MRPAQSLQQDVAKGGVANRYHLADEAHRSTAEYIIDNVLWPSLQQTSEQLLET